MTVTTLAILIALEFLVMYVARRRAIRQGKTPIAWHYVVPPAGLATVILAAILIRHS